MEAVMDGATRRKENVAMETSQTVERLENTQPAMTPGSHRDGDGTGGSSSGAVGSTPCTAINVRGRQKGTLCGRKTKPSAGGRCGLHRTCRSSSQPLDESGCPSATLESPSLVIPRAIGGEDAVVDDAYCADLEFIGGGGNTQARASGQFSADVRKFERALSSIEEGWAKDAYKKTQNMGYLEVRRQ